VGGFFLKNILLFLAFGGAVGAEAKVSLDPISKKGLQKEDKFLKNVEKRVKATSDNGHAPSTNSATVKSQEIPHEASFSSDKSAVSEAGGIAVKTAPPQNQQNSSGFYCGISFAMENVYHETDLWSISHQAKKPGDNNALLKQSEVRTIYYGSYAYNRNTWLADYGAFLGYSLHISSRVLLGLELQGKIGRRSVEIASNGVYAQRGGEAISTLGYSATFRDSGYYVSEVDFGYTRPTLAIPYNFSLLPRFGIVLPSALVYTVLGVRYGLWEVTDNPETIDVVTTYDVKKGADVIHSKNEVSIIGGVGIEALVTKQIFLRFECLYSNGPSIKKEASELQSDAEVNANRQLEALDIKSMRCLSIGLGAGWRF
jgi:opacity protein-like surface antigen